MTAINVEKVRLGPITERYQNGEYQHVEREKNGIKRKAVCGLDRSHSKDYKVPYVGDPVLVIRSPNSGMSHDELEEVLRDKGLWKDEMRPIHVPKGDGWQNAFATLPRSSNQLHLFKSRLETLVENDLDLLEGEHGVTAYV